MGKLKKIKLKLNLIFLKIMYRVKYSYYLKHFPRYLKKLGVNFSGDIQKTGFISTSVKFDSVNYAKYITIGERTIMSSNVLLLVHDYTIGLAMQGMKIEGVKQRNLPHFLKEIKIGNYCFIGARSIILPGTTIGDNVIVGAGAVVKGNIPDGVVIAGNPARVVMTTADFVKRHMEKNDFIVK